MITVVVIIWCTMGFISLLRIIDLPNLKKDLYRGGKALLVLLLFLIFGFPIGMLFDAHTLGIILAKKLKFRKLK
jgi:hypothetical protein